MIFEADSALSLAISYTFDSKSEAIAAEWLLLIALDFPLDACVASLRRSEVDHVDKDMKEIE